MKWKIAMKWGKKSLSCFLKSPAQFLQIPIPALPKEGRVRLESLPGPSKGGESEIGAILLRKGF